MSNPFKNVFHKFASTVHDFEVEAMNQTTIHAKFNVMPGYDLKLECIELQDSSICYKYDAIVNSSSEGGIYRHDTGLDPEDGGIGSINFYIQLDYEDNNGKHRKTKRTKTRSTLPILD